MDKAPSAEEQAKTDLKAALADLGDILVDKAGGKANITPEQEQKLLPVMTRLFDAAFRLGHIKFKAAARFVRDQIKAAMGEDVAALLPLEQYQGGYIAMSARYRDQGADKPAVVAAVESLDEPVATPAEAAPAAPAPVEVAEQEKPAAIEAVDTAAHEAATSPTNELPEPSDAQKEAGNYKMGHVRIGGLDISIENPEGSTRGGVDRGGEAWKVTMSAHYGYIKGTIGRDKDHIDVYVKPGTAEDFSGPVFVADQAHVGTQRFDEHKVMLGFATAEEAKQSYAAHFSDGKGEDRLRGLTEVTLPEFREWLESGPTTKPFAPWAERRAIAATPAEAAGPAPLDLPPGADYSAFKGKTVSINVGIEGGESATLKMDAADAMTDVDKRIDVMQELIACLSK